MQNIFLGAKKYISEQIEFSKIINTPCEYSIIDNFLPEKVFNEIDLNWPSEVMVPIPETGRTKKYSERKVMFNNVLQIGLTRKITLALDIKVCRKQPQDTIKIASKTTH